MMNKSGQGSVLEPAEFINITYYTDPLCCWSWAMEPVLEHMHTKLGMILRWRICMGGLLPGWGLFSDNVNAVSRPVQMGPVWMHASRLANVPINWNLWHFDPPSSSYPACIAFKSVQLQNEEYAKQFLRMLRTSCMIDGINISKTKELVQLADKLKDSFPHFNTNKFIDDLFNGAGKKAFESDLQEIRQNEIRRFPAFIIRQAQRPSLIVTGYKSKEAFAKLIFSNFAVDSTKVLN